MMQKPVLVMKGPAEAPIQMAATGSGVQPQVMLNAGQRPGVGDLWSRLTGPNTYGWKDRGKAALGLGGKALAGIGAGLSTMSGLANASRSGDLGGVTNAPVGAYAAYSTLDPSGFTSANPTEAPPHPSVSTAVPPWQQPPVPPPAPSTRSTTYPPGHPLASRRTPPGGGGPNWPATPTPPPPTPDPATQVVVENPATHPAETELNAEIAENKWQDEGYGNQDMNTPPPAVAPVAAPAPAVAPTPTAIPPLMEPVQNKFDQMRVSTADTMTPETAAAETTGGGITPGAPTPPQGASVAIPPTPAPMADVVSPAEAGANVNQTHGQGSYQNPNSIFFQDYQQVPSQPTPSVAVQKPVQPWANPITGDDFSQYNMKPNVGEAGAILDSSKYGRGATQAEYSDPNVTNMNTVNPFGGVQTEPSSLTAGGIPRMEFADGWGEENALNGSSNLSQHAADPWRIEAGFVPAFMEVYGDIIKTMTPHQVGSLASHVFLKMTR